MIKCLEIIPIKILTIYFSIYFYIQNFAKNILSYCISIFSLNSLPMIINWECTIQYSRYSTNKMIHCGLMTRLKNNIWKKENPSVAVTCTMRNRGNFSYYDFFLLTTIRRCKKDFCSFNWVFLFLQPSRRRPEGRGRSQLSPWGREILRKAKYQNTGIQWALFFQS